MWLQGMVIGNAHPRCAPPLLTQFSRVFFFFFSVTRNYFNLSFSRKRVTFMVHVRGERGSMMISGCFFGNVAANFHSG